jgi:hypothetical protein
MEQEREWDEHGEEELFAVRSSGHSPVARASSIKGVALIDLGLFNEVILVADRNSVVVGNGCRWVDLYRSLEEHGLTVAGGRNSAVGVGGLTLGRGISFFSPQLNMVCSNIIEYEVVLPGSSMTSALATSNPDLWRAQGGTQQPLDRGTLHGLRLSFVQHMGRTPVCLLIAVAKGTLVFLRMFNGVNANDQRKPHDELAVGPPPLLPTSSSLVHKPLQ